MTSVPPLGRLEQVDPRKAWTSEPQDFTPWLQDNIGLLGEALGLEIGPDVQREVSVGGFSADLVAHDVGTDRRILIENQLAPTDHSHLGQILTYASGLSADILVWIATRVRDEHAQAVTWINEHTGEDVLAFAIEIGLMQIGNSALAPHFKVVVAPNEWQKSISTANPGAESKTAALYRSFWSSFITALKERDPGATTTDPAHAPRANWFAIGLGRTGFTTAFVFGWSPATSSARLRSEVYIDTGDKELNERFFDQLRDQREQIEADLDLPLEWSRRDDIQACRIYVEHPGSISDDAAQLSEYLTLGVDRMLALKKVFSARISHLSAE